MKVLSPTHPPARTEDLFSGFSPPATFRAGFARRSESMATTQSSEIVEEGGEKVYVAVGKSVAKAGALLQWCFRTFVGSEICILHVHKPSPLIPTLLGKLPASQANPEVVTAFRNEEWEATGKLLQNYKKICSTSKVKASIVTSEADQVQLEIVNLVSRHDIKKLVIGAIPDCSKLKKCSSKASYAAKMAPPFCKIWFVNKGKLVWTRQDSQSSSSFALISQELAAASNLRSQSAPSSKSNDIYHPECIRSRSAQYPACSGTRNCFQKEGAKVEPSSLTLPTRCYPSTFQFFSPASLSSSSGYASSAVSRVSSDSNSKVEKEGLYGWLKELKKEAEESRDEADSELLMSQKLEAEAVEAISNAKAFESAYEREVKLRKAAEEELRTTILEQEKLLEEREVLTRELQKAMRNIAVLDSRAREANCRREDVAGELKLIQSSLASLRQERQKIQQQKIEAKQWLDHWKSGSQVNGENINGLVQFSGESLELAEFSLLDLQAATCNFSESFKIGRGGNGAVYKGEMLNRTVAIKMLHPHSIQKQPEFCQEAQILGRVHHPHLVTLIGVCPEAWSLVFEYLPGGSLQDRLFHGSNVCPLDWKTRVQIISEIASGLLFLHSSGPEGITHGNLKPNNVLLDSENCCKVGDFGIFRLAPVQTLRCPSFRSYTETGGAFPYTDPEFHRTGILTPKSDVFSFGLIILQLLTGKPPAGLACEVRKMVCCGKITAILDSSAGEWSTFVARRLVELGLQCCELNGRDRPSLTPTLVRELEHLHVLEERLVPSFFLCPILQEIMHDPQVAADGFTYEGEALRGWLENGRETSPMTNLKLSHLTLTPNHALRLAIQEWLCKS
ncbi:unnamed protein product [Coffea canephora]|uniref:RING-type E3 ubiquitin transferase n=1 Tax=Coffea canephora TaxID=49390 RepID=A0A068UKQ0_COFCA|nr:unnamed protein product [Coffea canephora]